METLLFRIRAEANPKLTDDEYVAKCMESLMEKWPAVKGYQHERSDNDDYINILLWGDLER